VLQGRYTTGDGSCQPIIETVDLALAHDRTKVLHHRDRPCQVAVLALDLRKELCINIRGCSVRFSANRVARRCATRVWAWGVVVLGGTGMAIRPSAWTTGTRLSASLTALSACLWALKT
jgi:hypothetical protein